MHNSTVILPKPIYSYMAIFYICYYKLFLIQDEGSDGIVSKAIQNPDEFVLKPEREGGGT